MQPITLETSQDLDPGVMKMKHKIYGSVIKTNSPKTNLEDAIYWLLSSLDNIVIKPEEEPAFREAITNNVNKLNKAYSKCRAIEPKFHGHPGDDNVFISLGDSFTYLLKGVRDYSDSVNELIDQSEINLTKKKKG